MTVISLFLGYWLYDYASNYEKWYWDLVEDGRMANKQNLMIPAHL